jgi:hypothetical protein
VVLIGLLLFLIAIAAGVWLVIGTQSLTTPIDLDTPGFHVSATPLALLIAGAAVLFVLWLGLAAIRASVKRRRRAAREAKEAQRQAEFEENIRADERARAEETHQNAMAERDRVREEEFSAKLAERDRIRDADERTRLAEHEQRVRADERTRVEDEHSRRNAEASRTPATAEGAVGAGGGADAGAAAAPDGAGTAPDSAGSSTAEDAGGARVADASVPGRHEGPEEGGADAAGGAATDDSSTWDTSRRDRTDELDAEDERQGHRYKTVADEIMGRGPTGRG